MFLDLSKVHAVEDELIHQYLIVGICKAVGVLMPVSTILKTKSFIAYSENFSSTVVRGLLKLCLLKRQCSMMKFLVVTILRLFFNIKLEPNF